MKNVGNFKQGKCLNLPWGQFRERVLLAQAHVNFFPMSRNIYRTQSAGVEKPGIIMHHSKTQYISLKALTNELKFIDLGSTFATSYRQKTKISLAEQYIE